MSGDSSQPILNPNVYLNYLQPSIANDYEAARDVVLVTLGVLSWDILSSIHQDWTLIRTHNSSPAVLLAYFSSRTCALAVVIISVLAKTGPVQNCDLMQLILCIFWILASASSSYLFLKRVHAIFLNERLVCYVFTVFWIAQVGASAVLLPATLHTYYQLTNTKHCMNVNAPGYVAVAFYVPVMFDVFVFSATTYKILKSHPRPKKSTHWMNFGTNKRPLPHFSRAIIQGGQQYHMITHGVNITRANMALSSGISPPLQLVALVPAIAITSAMACRVFRNLKLEASKKTEVGNLTAIEFANKERADVQLLRRSDVTSTETDLEEC